MTVATLQVVANHAPDFVRHIAVLRERFLSSGDVDLSPLRKVIRDSWQRCRVLAVDANLSLARFVAPGDLQLRQLRELHAPLLNAAHPVLLRLKATLGSAGYVIAVSDAEGTLLEVTGDNACQRHLARKGLLPGSNWSEASAGTNAIGVALVTKRIVQLVGAEHYCAGWQDVTCTAAPMFHSDDGTLIGVLDITGDYRLVRPFLTGVLAAAAAEVQRRYRLEQLRSPGRSRFFHGWSSLSAVTASGDNQPDQFERLTMAVRMVSAVFDPTQAPLVIAGQMGWLLDAAGIALIEGKSDEAPLTHFWAKPGMIGEQALTALRDTVRDPMVLAWRLRPEPFLDHASAATLAAIQAIGGALAGFPLHDVGGVILALRLPAMPWSLVDQQTGATLAAHGAAMLRYARLYTDLQAYAAQTEALNTLALFLSTLLDPMRQLDVVLQYILTLTRLDSGLIALKDADQLVIHGIAATAVDKIQIASLVETVITTGQSVWLCRQHATTHEPFLLPLADFCDLVALPLILNASGNGALIVGSRAHRYISGEDLTLLMTIAQQVGLTLSNARLRQVASENEALRQADHLKSAFLASVSHDLRSPLTAIRASVEDLLERQCRVSTDEHRALLCNIARETVRLSRFVDQLLDLSRIEASTLPVDREWVEIGALINDVASSFRQHFAGCALETLMSPALPWLYIDPVLISQVLWNLLENACKYGPAEGPVAIEAFSTNTHLMIGVSDRGPGIPLSERNRIFDRFYRLERDRRNHRVGSGLGLAICHGIVTAHQGSIWVDDRPGGGSIFRVMLPLHTVESGGWDREDREV
jgi:two-component system sensor histidine kinase KdpD